MANLVPLLILHKHLKEQEDARNRSRRNSKKSSQSQSKTTSSGYSSKGSVFDTHDYCRFTDDLKWCVSCALRKDPKALDIANKLITKMESLFAESQSKINQALLALTPKSQQIRSAYLSACHKVEGLGFKLDYEEDDSLYYLLDSAFDGHFSYNRERKIIALNGINLTRAKVESGENPYRDNLETFVQNNPNSRENYENALSVVEKLSKNKLLLKVSKKRYTKLCVAQKELDKAKRIYYHELLLKKECDLYESLTNEQKQTLLEFFKAKENYENMSNDIEKVYLRSLLEQGYYNNIPKKREEYEEFVSTQQSIAESTLTQEEKDYLVEFCKDLVKQMRIAEADDKVYKLINSFDLVSRTAPGHKALEMIYSNIISLNKEMPIEENISKTQDQSTIKE